MLGLRVGLLLFQLFPSSRATDIVFVTRFCIAVGTTTAWCGGRCAMPDGHRHPVVLTAVHGSLGLPGWRLFLGFTLLSPFSHSSPSLIGLLASVDVKQQSLSLSQLSHSQIRPGHFKNGVSSQRSLQYDKDTSSTTKTHSVQLSHRFPPRTSPNYQRFALP